MKTLISLCLCLFFISGKILASDFSDIFSLYKDAVPKDVGFDEEYAQKIWQDHDLSMDEVSTYKTTLQAAMAEMLSKSLTSANDQREDDENLRHLQDGRMLQSIYGSQSLFKKQRLLGAYLAKGLILHNFPYERVLGFLAFHRHIMAQMMMAPHMIKAKRGKYKLFGALCTVEGWQHVSTRLYSQFPLANAVIQAKLSQDSGAFVDCDRYREFFEAYKLSWEATHQKCPLFEHQGSIYPLSVLLLPKEPVLALQEAAELFGLKGWEKPEQRVLVFHGGMDMLAVRQDLLPLLDEFLHFIKTAPVTEGEAKKELIKTIAKIAYLESHLTTVCRGGGTIPEMLVEGLLLIHAFPSLLSNTQINVWSDSMCFPRSEQFAEFFYLKLVNS